MLRSVFLKSIRDLRRGFVWWAVGLVGYVAMIVSVYPTIRDNPELNKLVESYPEALKAFIAFGGQLDFTSAAGYLGSELFSFMFPALFLVASVGNGAGSIAGEEERGTLDLLLAEPLSRTPDRRSRSSARCAWRSSASASSSGSRCGSGRARSRMEVSAAHLAAATVVLVAAGDRLRRGRVHARRRNGTQEPRRRGDGRPRRGRVPRELARRPRRRPRAVPEALALLPLRGRRPAPPGLDPWHTLFLVAVGAAAAAAGVVLFGRRDVAA